MMDYRKLAKELYNELIVVEKDGEGGWAADIDIIEDFIKNLVGVKR